MKYRLDNLLVIKHNLDFLSIEHYNIQMRKLLMLMLFSVSTYAQSFDLGIASSSAHSGYIIPALYMSSSYESMAVSFLSGGYKTKVDYSSNYILNVFLISEIGNINESKVMGGFGLGGYYSARGFRDGVSDNLTESADSGFGFSFRVSYFISESIFLRMEQLYAMGQDENSLLIFQDVGSLSLGARW